MKVFSKINRGVILTVIVLLGVAAYLIGLEIMQSSASKDIEALCQKYVAAELNYHMLPEGQRVEKPSMTEAELDSYIAQMREELIPYSVDNEQTYRYLLESLEENLRSQADGNAVTYTFTKEIVKTEITFDGDKASVRLTSLTTYEGISDDTPAFGSPAVIQNDSAKGETTDTISMQRVNGEWKLTYASLNRPYEQTSSY